MKDEEQVLKALLKRATGYNVKEFVEEYGRDESTNAQILLKRKVSAKHIPPEISAIKILLSYYGEKSFEELENLTDEQLLIERDKLISKLKDA